MAGNFLYLKHQKDIEELIGVPFVSKGRDLEGFDCWGNLSFVSKNFWH